MGKTIRGSKHRGYDFGAKYDCDHSYSGYSGKTGKDLADSERRNKSKKLIRESLETIDDEYETLYEGD